MKRRSELLIIFLLGMASIVSVIVYLISKQDVSGYIQLIGLMALLFFFIEMDRNEV